MLTGRILNSTRISPRQTARNLTIEAMRLPPKTSQRVLECGSPLPLCLAFVVQTSLPGISQPFLAMSGLHRKRLATFDMVALSFLLAAPLLSILIPASPAMSGRRGAPRVLQTAECLIINARICSIGISRGRGGCH